MLLEEKPNHLETIIKLLLVVAALVLVFITPFYLYFKYENQGLLMYGSLILFLAPLIAFTFKKFIYFKPNEIKSAFLSKKVQIGFTVVFNIFIFFNFGLNTLITIPILFCLYVVSYLFSFMYFNNIFNVFNIAFVSTLLLSFFLMTNFYFSKNMVKESYYCYYDSTDSSISLDDDNKYEDYNGIKYFFNDKKAIGATSINYFFEEGYFGYRVLKKHEFNNYARSKPL